MTSGMFFCTSKGGSDSCRSFRSRKIYGRSGEFLLSISVDSMKFLLIIALKLVRNFHNDREPDERSVTVHFS